MRNADAEYGIRNPHSESRIQVLYSALKIRIPIFALAFRIHVPHQALYVVLALALFGSVSLKFAEDFGGKWPFSPCHFAYFVGSQAGEKPLQDAKEVEVADATKFHKGDAPNAVQ